MKNIILSTVLIGICILVSYQISGCTSVQDMRDDDYTQGCVVVEAQTKLGYFGQEGQAEVCKLKCSETLPEGYEYSYESKWCNVGIKQ